jgi:polyisoprenoid-binding protein YceI
MTTATSRTLAGFDDVLAENVGAWEVLADRSSVFFGARVAGIPIDGRFPLSGALLLGPSLDDSAAYFSAMTNEVQTGSRTLDSLLAGPAFLDASLFPEVWFQSESIIRVPTGWRGIGSLTLKEVERPVVCDFAIAVDEAATLARRLYLAASWAIDSEWITLQAMPKMARRITMGCSVVLAPIDDVPRARGTARI